MKFKEVKLQEKNEFNIDLDHIAIGEPQHIHNGEKHTLLMLTGIEKKLINSLDAKNKEVVLQNYLNRNYYHEKIDVANYLRSKYMIDINENAN